MLGYLYTKSSNIRHLDAFSAVQYIVHPRKQCVATAVATDAAAGQSPAVESVAMTLQLSLCVRHFDVLSFLRCWLWLLSNEYIQLFISSCSSLMCSCAHLTAQACDLLAVSNSDKTANTNSTVQDIPVTINCDSGYVIEGSASNTSQTLSCEASINTDSFGVWSSPPVRRCVSKFWRAKLYVILFLSRLANFCAGA